jgi:hypothetical protein
MSRNDAPQTADETATSIQSNGSNAAALRPSAVAGSRSVRREVDATAWRGGSLPRVTVT